VKVRFLHPPAPVRAVSAPVALTLGFLLSVAPVFGSPIRADDSAASLIPDSVLTFPDVTHVNPGDLPEPVPATCAQAIGDDARPAAPDAGSIRVDLRGNLIATLDLSPASSAPTPEQTAEQPAEMTSADSGDGAHLVAGLLNCDGSSAASGAVPAGNAPATPRVSERLRAAVQAVAITAALVLVTVLGYIVAAMTRRTSHAGSGRRRY
jgi:hypothetical protein